MKAPVFADAPPPHPDMQLTKAECGFSRFLRMDVVHFRHRLFSLKFFEAMGSRRVPGILVP